MEHGLLLYLRHLSPSHSLVWHTTVSLSILAACCTRFNTLMKVGDGPMPLFITDLANTTIARIEHRMRQGQASESGFLAPDESLVEVIRRDEGTLADLGLVAEQVAERLSNILDAARAFYEQRHHVPPGGIPVAPHYRVFGFDIIVKGIQACPFEDDEGRRCQGHRASIRAGAQDYVVINDATNTTLGFPYLALHLIRDHHFFEGSVECRVDPLLAARTLDLLGGGTRHRL